MEFLDTSNKSKVKNSIIFSGLQSLKKTFKKVINILLESKIIFGICLHGAETIFRDIG